MTLPRLFLSIAVFFAGMAAALALFLVVDRLVVPDYSPSYHKLLLENIPVPRIIIDSGSNSRSNIEPAIMEAEFSIHTIVIADNINVDF
jgi:hypothetical protein